MVDFEHMEDPNLVNIGTERQPVYVSSNAVSTNRQKEESYWRGIANGSTLPSTQIQTDQEALDILLKKQ